MNANLQTLERAVGHPPHGIVNDVLARQVVEFLNDLFQQDPHAIEDLVEQRVRCNDILAAHPTVPVQDPKDGEGGALLGILGILNGLCGAWDEESAPKPHLAFFGPVCACYEHGRLTGFRLSAETVRAPGRRAEPADAVRRPCTAR
jgi:hypothetical protein